MTVNEKIDNALADLKLNVDYITNPRSSEKRTDPYITYIEISQITTHYENDEEQARAYYMDIDIYTAKPWQVPELIKDIEKRLKEVGFRVLPHGADMWDDETKILHKPLSFIYEEEK